MTPIILAVFAILKVLLSAISWMLIISAILSWLIAFNVVNTRNPTVYRIVDALDRFTAPILEPFRRLVPPMGGFDISFILCLATLWAIREFLLDPARDNLILLVNS
jgi:YggT family protein